jgi:hypothetical protein
MPFVRLEHLEEIVKGTLAGLLALAAMLTGCARGLRNEKAIREAIEAHLKTRSDLMMAKMTLEVESVKFSRDSAEADVKYHSKDNPDLAVSVHYSLKLAGNHWEVVSSSSANGGVANPHGAGAPPSPQGPPAAPVPAPSH